MDNKIIIIILVLVGLTMLNKKSCGCSSKKENFAFRNFPKRDFYGVPTYGTTKVNCPAPPVTFKQFLKNEKLDGGKFNTANQSNNEKIYMRYRHDYANECEGNDYYARTSYNL
jgi:hypothetical protein